MSVLEELGLEQVSEEVIIRPMLTTNRAVDLYLGEVQRRLRPRSHKTYSRILDEFLNTLPVDEDVAKVTDVQVERFLGRYRSKAPGYQAQIFSVLNRFFWWARRTGKIRKSPMENMLPPRRLPPEALDVVTLSSDDVRKLLAAAQGWTEKLSVALPAYMGCRRHAASQLRVRDYDRANRSLRFVEKGGKTIWKPVPDELAAMLEARLEYSGVAAPAPSEGLVAPDDYLIPSESTARNGDRDDRVVWNAVKRAAKNAGVEAHVHALRAAFAVFFLETHGRDLIAAQAILGHRDPNTTMVYLRRLDREAAMEQNRDLSWSANSEEVLVSKRQAEKEGFEPSNSAFVEDSRLEPNIGAEA